MPRRKMPEPTEPLRVVKREEWEDDVNYYVKEWYNRGGTNIDIHPKHPEIPKDVLLNEMVAPALLEAWRNRRTKTSAEREKIEK